MTYKGQVLFWRHQGAYGKINPWIYVIPYCDAILFDKLEYFCHIRWLKEPLLPAQRLRFQIQEHTKGPRAINIDTGGF